MESEFEAFAVARQGALFRYAYLLVGDRGYAEDLLQESLTKTFMRWHRLRDSANAEAYTRRVITNTAFSWFRRKGWAEKPRDDVPPLPHTDDTTTRMWLRAVLVLRYFEDLSLAETARVLGCSEGTVKSQGARALARLRATLEPEQTMLIEEVVL